MNSTNFEHAIYALLAQLAVGILTGDWWAGAAVGTVFFLGREHAQSERKLAGAAGVSALNPLVGFQVWRWSRDSQLDLLFPAIATLAVAVGHHLGFQVPFVSLFVLLVVLNIADAVLTVRVLDSGGRELNPVLAKVMAWIGVVPALALFKCIGLAVIWAALAIGLRDWPYTVHLTAVLCGLYGLLVCHNWQEREKQLR